MGRGTSRRLVEGLTPRLCHFPSTTGCAGGPLPMRGMGRIFQAFRRGIGVAAAFVA